MAKKAVQSPSVKDVQVFVAAQVEQARKYIGELEKDLSKRAKAQQKELEALVKSIREGTPLKAFEKQANAATGEVKKRLETAGDEVKERLEELQGQILGALGVATSEELSQIHREITKLSKKVDALVSKKGTSNGAEA